MEYGGQYADGFSVSDHVDDSDQDIGAKGCRYFYDCLCECQSVFDSWKVWNALFSTVGYEGAVLLCGLSDVTGYYICCDDRDGSNLHDVCGCF